jgi:site-specific recombinase XerD
LNDGRVKEREKRMNYPSTRFVFDRKKTATKTKAALIQVEILYGKKKKYVTTGVKVYRDQWSEKTHIIKRSDMYELNEEIELVKDNIDNYIRELKRKREEFSWDDFESFLEHKPEKKITETFIEYAYRRITERTDISPGTRRNHVKVMNVFAEFGRIVTFDELTRNNLLAFYEWLMARKVTKLNPDGTSTEQTMAQQTVSSYMKCLKVYIHDAQLHGMIATDPTDGLKIKRGESEPNRWLTEAEVKKIEKTKMPSGSLQRVKDRFLVQCYTGLSYADLMDLSIEKIEEIDGTPVIVGNRIKTGEPYTIAVLPEIKEILEKYNYQIPKITDEQYNVRLKVVAELAGINKKLASHWARRTFACMMINRGVRAETLAQMMGHSDMRTTMEFYARMKKDTVVNEMLDAMKKKKGKK